MNGNTNPEVRAAICCGLACFALADAASADSDDSPWEAELGIGVTHHDNFFFRRESPTTPAPSATLTRAYASGEREFDTGEREWSLFGSAAATFVDGVDDADSQEWRLGGRTAWGATRVTLEATYLPNLLYSEELTGTFYDRTGAALEVRQSFRDGVWLAGEFEQTRWEFDQLEQGRDADVPEVTATFRFPLGENAGLRLFGSWAEKDARAPENNWNSIGYGIAAELAPTGRWNLFARVRVREREYRDAPIGDVNFARDDTILDGLINARVRIGERWGLAGQVEHRNGDSSRLDRNYDATMLSLSAFVTF